MTDTPDDIVKAVADTLTAYRTRYTDQLAEQSQPRPLLITRWQLRLIETELGTTDRTELDRRCSEMLGAHGFGDVHLVLFDE